jgi:maltose O-acetyltransferase
LIDLIYPELIEIGDNVTIGSNSMIFAHVNPTANEFLKKHGYPRTVKPVQINKGAVVSVGCIIIAGVTVGENSIVGAGSVVASDIPDNCVALGNPARVIKKIE